LFAFSGSGVYPKTTFTRDKVHLQCGYGKKIVAPVDWLYQPTPDAEGHHIISADRLINGHLYHGRLSISESTLTIHNVTIKDSGVYICREHMGAGLMHRVNLTVKGKICVKYFYSVFHRTASF